jgi:hypothetical protein
MKLRIYLGALSEHVAVSVAPLDAAGKVQAPTKARIITAARDEEGVLTGIEAEVDVELVPGALTSGTSSQTVPLVAS